MKLFLSLPCHHIKNASQVNLIRNKFPFSEVKHDFNTNVCSFYTFASKRYHQNSNICTGYVDSEIYHTNLAQV